MLFHEIYGCYYEAVAAILSEAVKGTLTEKRMRSLCDDHAFSESFMTIIPALTEQRWQLLNADLSTPLKQAPQLAPTELQLRWLKAIMLDPRIRLFDADADFLADVEPLFSPDDIVYTDRFTDGDDYTDPRYIAVFRELLAAVKNGTKARIRYSTAKTTRETVVTPYLFEYSEREDKLRVWVNGGKVGNIISVARVEYAEALCEAGNIPQHCPVENHELLVMEVSPERQSVERALMHFSHYEKETEQLSDGGCRIRLRYSKADMSELVGQVLSFGPMVRVVEPPEFIGLIKERLSAQRALGSL